MKFQAHNRKRKRKQKEKKTTTIFKNCIKTESLNKANKRTKQKNKQIHIC